MTIGIIADDLTGANDSALQFFSAGLTVQVMTSLNALSEQVASLGNTEENKLQSAAITVWTVNTDSRHLPEEEARLRVTEAAKLLNQQFGVDRLYKKMDSTLRGHIAAESLAVLEALDLDCAVIAPAYPQEGRRTVGGYQMLKGMPVERTHLLKDPLWPIRESHLPTILEQQTKPEWVGYITLATVLDGAGPVLKELSELIKAGKKLVVVDATSTEDLEQIALAIKKIQAHYRVLPCGSAGLAHALSRQWLDIEQQVAPRKSERIKSFPAPVLMVMGSNSDTTRKQMLHLIENYTFYGQGSQLQVVNLTPEVLLANPDSLEENPELEILADLIVDALGEQNTVILTSALHEEHLPKMLEKARALGVDDHRTSHIVQNGLALITQKVLAKKDKKQVKLITSGGETTAALCQMLHLDQLKILDAVEANIPLMSANNGQWLMSKSGSFGQPAILAHLIQYIKLHETTALHVVPGD